MANEFEIVDVKVPDGISSVRVPKGTSDADATQIAMQDYYTRATEASKQSVLDKTEARGIGEVAKQGLIKGVAGLGDLIVGMPANYQNLYKTFKGEPNVGLAQPVTTSLIQKGYIKPENEPVTPVENMVSFGSQMLPSLLNPASTVRGFAQRGALEGTKKLGGQLAVGGAQATTGAVANEVLNSLGVENPYAKFAGVGLATAIPGTYLGMRGNVAGLVNKDIKNMSPEMLQEADNLVKRSYAAGSPITAAEAIAQVSGSSRLPSLQRFVENQPRGQSAKTMADFLRNRTEGANAYLNDVMAGIAPGSRSTEIPSNLQKTASGFIEKSEKGLTQGVKPYYKAAEQTVIPAVEISGFLTDPKIKQAVDYVRKSPDYGVKNLAQNDFRVLQAAKDYLDDAYQAQNNPMASSLQKKASAVTWTAREKLDDFLASKSPEYTKGRDIYRTAQEATIQPRKEGLLGQIAESTPTMEAQSKLLTPKVPLANPDEIKKTAELLRRQNPKALPEWTKENLNQIFTKSLSENRGKTPEFGAADFASKVMGNERQKENLQALITSTSGMQAYRGFENMIDVFKAQGQRMPAGSATAFNQLINEQMGQGGPIIGTAKIAANPFSLSKNIEELQMAGNANKLAKLLTDPEGVKKLEQLAKLDPKSKMAQNIVNSLSAGYISVKPPIEENK